MANYTIKLRALLVISFCASMFSCATTDDFKTMNTDLPKDQLSRSQYYGMLADNYFQNKNFDEAADYYRLSILHSKINLNSRAKLMQTYLKLNNENLAYAEFKLVSEQYYMHLNDLSVAQVNQFLISTQDYSNLESFNKFYFERSGSVYSLWQAIEASLVSRSYHKALEYLKLVDINVDKKYIEEKLYYIAFSKVYRNLKEYKKSIEYISKISSAERTHRLTLEEEILIYRDLKDSDKVVSLTQKLFKYNGRSFEFSELLAQVAFQIGQYDIVVDELNWQLNVTDHTKKSNHYTIYLKKLQLAHTYFLKGDFNSARKNYVELLDSSLDSNELMYYLALTEFELLNSYAALDYVDEIEVESKFFVPAQIKASRYEFERGNLDNALNRLRKSHYLRLDSKEIYTAYTEYLIRTGNLVEAVALSEKGLNKFGYVEDLSLFRAYCHYKLKNIPAFKQDLSAVINRNPKNHRAYDMLANLWYIDQKNPLETKFFTEKALDYGSQNQELMKILAWTLLDLGREEQAVALLEGLMDSNPMDSTYPKILSDVYRVNKVFNRYEQFTQIANSLENKESIQMNLRYLPHVHTPAVMQRYSPSRLPASQ